MYKEIDHIYRRANILADMATTGLAYIASAYILTFTATKSFVIPQYIMRYFWLFYIVVLLWPLLLNINGLYPTNRIRVLSETSKVIIYSSFQGLILILAILYTFGFQTVSRLQIFNFAALAAVFLIIKEWIVSAYLCSIRKSGANLRNLVIIGPIGRSGYFVNKLKTGGNLLGLKMAGLIVPDNESGEKEAHGCKVLGSFSNVEKILNNNAIDNVIITSYWEGSYGSVENIIAHCEERGIEMWLPVRLFNTKIAKPDSDEFFQVPMFVFRTEPKLSWQLVGKIIMDRAAGFVLSILTFPIILVAGALIKMTSPGPAIFKQKRCGFHGRIFTVYKLRTMYIGAEEMKDRLKAENIMKGPLFKMEKDPRITPLGALLRKTSLDEFPQFWNVLKGDMSLVGPRPSLPKEISEYKGWHRRRLSMKPGITGLVQVSGRSSITNFDDWADLDLEYIDDWSLWLDIKIISKTIFVVLSTKGAK